MHELHVLSKSPSIEHFDLLPINIDESSTLKQSAGYNDLFGLDGSFLHELEFSELIKYKKLIFKLIKSGKSNEVWQLFEGKELEELVAFKFAIRALVQNGEENEIWQLFEDQELEELADFKHVIEVLAQNGKENEIWQLFQSKPLRELSRWQTTIDVCVGLDRDKLLEFILIKLHDSLTIFNESAILNLSEEQIDDVVNQYKSIVSKLSFPEMLFFRIIAERNGYLNQRMLNGITKFSRFALEVEKTHSRLVVYKNFEKNILLVNEIPSVGAQTWQEVIDNNIPTAPIFKTRQLSETTTRVYSRFCGLAIRNIKMYDLPPETKEEILTQRNKIEADLTSKGISHGHIHDGNFVVELVKKDYFNKQGGWDNVNDTPFLKDNFSYDFNDKERNWNEWQIVVRIIDFDLSNSQSDRK